MPRPALTSRDDLTDALIRVVVEQGLDAVSIRTVARAAGVSIGTVQYHFPPRTTCCWPPTSARSTRSPCAPARSPQQDPAPRAYVRALLRELLPLDDRREAELRVALAFSARSVYSPRLTELYTDGYRALVDAVAGRARAGRRARRGGPGVEPRRDAVQAVALADGLAWHALCAPSRVSAADAAEAALDAHLARLLPPR